MLASYFSALPLSLYASRSTKVNALCTCLELTSVTCLFPRVLANQSVYSLYADYVLKNPFYELDMPIRCELFDLQLTSEVTLTMNA